MGTSETEVDILLKEKDHPHAYGDKYFNEFCAAVRTGSSPRVWGQEKSAIRARSLLGIIPTRMGTSQSI